MTSGTLNSPHALRIVARSCIAPDFMGLGFTEVAKGQSLAPAGQAEMIVALLDTLSIPSVDLIANDSGGAVAQLLVTRDAACVRTLLLTNCDTEHDSPPPVLLPVIEASRKFTFADERFVPQLADKSLARSARGIGGLCYADPAHPTDEAIEYYFLFWPEELPNVIVDEARRLCDTN